MAGIEDVAHTWLVDPPWQKVFKHTLDVMSNYILYTLVTLGAIALSVKLLTTLGSGDLVCLLIGIENATTPGDLLPYASGGGFGMINYANTEQKCISAVFTPFMEYLPYILLLQTLILIICDKFTFKIPRIAQKVERFYTNIVEESLFGKDPDVAEDMTDPKTSTEAISRRRQRNEICESLKRSNIIHHVYIWKNLIESVIVFLFLPLNISYALVAKEDSAGCRIPIREFPGIVDREGMAVFQCRGKKVNFFIMALWVQITLLGLHLILSFGCMIWSWKFRAVTQLIKTIESMRKDWEAPVVREHDGEDFLFLFDFLAHSCGLESTLRVLTHSDENFYKICKPNFDVEHHLMVEEDKIKISWQPADIERWLHHGKRNLKSQRSITIDSYEVTIFPAESVKNTNTVPVIRDDDMDRDNEVYSTWFYDLSGGRTEYVITIACMIGKSRMKGEKVVTNLLPYGPEKPSTGMFKSAGINQVEIFWDPPRGEFTRYVLWIEHLDEKQQPSEANTPGIPTTSKSRLSHGSNSTLHDHQFLGPLIQKLTEVSNDRSNIRFMENLSYKLTTYTVMGLDPGERYRIDLGTRTGTVTTRQIISEIVLTKPKPVSGLMADEVTSTSCKLHWLRPSGHACLKGFQIQVTYNEGKVLKIVTVPKSRPSFTILGLVGGYDYEITIVALCASGNLRTESEPRTLEVTTKPESVKNLRLENSGPTTLNVKWDSTIPLGSTSFKHKLLVEGVDIDYNFQTDLSSEKFQYNFSKLPDPEGAGRLYKVTVILAVVTTGDNLEVQSIPTTESFATAPFKALNLRSANNSEVPLEILWNRSPTPHVCGYKVRWRTVEEGSKMMEDFVDQAPVELRTEDSDECARFVFPELQEDIVYKVNVYAVVKLPNGDFVESKELHGKFIWKDGQLNDIEDN